MSHLLAAADPLRDATLPKEFLRLAHYLGTIVEAGSAGIDWDPPGVPTPTAVRCRKRPRRKPCTGVVVTTITDVPDELSWHCDHCLAEEGVIRNWRTSPWNPDWTGRARGVKAPLDPHVERELRPMPSGWKTSKMAFYSRRPQRFGERERRTSHGLTAPPPGASVGA